MNINGAQLHLLINHAPVIGFPIVLFTFLWGRIRNEAQVKVYAFYLAILVWISTAISYFTGDPAEDTLRELPDFAKNMVHAHEEFAEIAFIVASIVGVAALLSLPQVQKRVALLNDARIRRMLEPLFAVGLLAVCILLAWVAHQGGLIRHIEIR
jgi:TRAP-type C4-dicarboxylate transport system permease large subunit